MRIVILLLISCTYLFAQDYEYWYFERDGMLIQTPYIMAEDTINWSKGWDNHLYGEKGIHIPDPCRISEIEIYNDNTTFKMSGKSKFQSVLDKKKQNREMMRSISESSIDGKRFDDLDPYITEEEKNNPNPSVIDVMKPYQRIYNHLLMKFKAAISDEHNGRYKQ